MKLVLALLFAVSSTPLAIGPAFAQAQKPTCHNMCTAYCNKRVAAGTSVGFNQCYRECLRVSTPPAGNKCTA